MGSLVIGSGTSAPSCDVGEYYKFKIHVLDASSASFFARRCASTHGVLSKSCVLGLMVSSRESFRNDSSLFTPRRLSVAMHWQKVHVPYFTNAYPRQTSKGSWMIGPGTSATSLAEHHRQHPALQAELTTFETIPPQCRK